MPTSAVLGYEAITGGSQGITVPSLTTMCMVQTSQGAPSYVRLGGIDFSLASSAGDTTIWYLKRPVIGAGTLTWDAGTGSIIYAHYVELVSTPVVASASDGPRLSDWVTCASGGHSANRITVSAGSGSGGGWTADGTATQTYNYASSRGGYTIGGSNSSYGSTGTCTSTVTILETTFYEGNDPQSGGAMWWS